jgi:hypothetical protein
MRLRRGKIAMALAVALCGLVVMGMAHLAQAATTGFINTVVSLPAPDGVKVIRTFDYRSDGAVLVSGAGVSLPAFIAGVIPVGTVVTAFYQSDVGIFTDGAGATVPTNVGNAGSYEITAVATLVGTVAVSAPATLGVAFTDVKARMYLQNPGNRALIAGTGYQDGTLIFAASGGAGPTNSGVVFMGSGGASATVFGIDFCGGGVILNCGAITDFHFSSTLTAPATGGGAGTMAYFAGACTGGAFCFAPVPVAPGPPPPLIFDADAFARMTGNIPGPATLWLIGSGLLGVAGVTRLRRKGSKAK